MMRAFDLANNESGNEILVPQMIALRIAGILYLLGDYPKAKEYAIKSFADKMKGHRKMLSYDLLSQISLKLGQYDSSSLYIKNALKYMFRRIPPGRPSRDGEVLCMDMKAKYTTLKMKLNKPFLSSEMLYPF
ncbi:MAG: hypothetical protein IPI30_21875 [Saprospiraceae bacterium]|nr:hypothetical protein [Candidatus Vicinibacter affinis]MBK7696863.1 hypothetical protein [Candidatus Vicinibacter affinis]